MSYVERVLELAQAPIEPEYFELLRGLEDTVVHSFLSGEIDATKQAEVLSKLDELNNKYVVLPYPGPLGGIFIKIGINAGEKFDYKKIIDLLDEERLHFAKATELGLHPTVRIYAVGKKTESGNPISFEIVVIYNSSKDREKMIQVLKAPQNPSPHDLAKIPPSSV